MPLLACFGCGAVFGFGLLLSGMTNPAKVLAFLDLGGAWDPSLALVMAGAIAVALPLFAVARRRSTSVLGGGPLHLPADRRIDRRLLLGSLLFGVGWGLAGICPGPAIVLVASLVPQALLFGAAMLVGMALYEWLA